MDSDFKKLLKKAGLTQVKLAKKLGQTPRNINRWKERAPEYVIIYLKSVIEIKNLQSQNEKLVELVENLLEVVHEARKLTHNQIVTLPIKYQPVSLSGVAQDLSYWEDFTIEKLSKIRGEHE